MAKTETVNISYQQCVTVSQTNLPLETQFPLGVMRVRQYEGVMSASVCDGFPV